jgi:hypothetical protein
MQSFKLQTGKEDGADKSTEGKSKNTVGSVVGLLIIIGVVWYFWGGGLQQQTSNSLDNINQKVASDAVDQYNIAKRNGTKIDACVQAGLVTAAYLQAKDETSYQQWKAIQNADCAAAGVPQ